MSEAVQETVVENAVEASVETTPAPVAPNSSQLLDIAKKEAQFRKAEAERKHEIASLQEKLKSYEEEVNYFKTAKDRYKDNPEEILEKLGIPYDELTNAVIDYYDRKEKGAKPPTAEDIQKKIDEELSRREAERYQKEAAAAIEGFAKEIGQFVKDSGDKFPHLTQLAGTLAESSGPDELIFEVISNYFEQTGQMLTLDEAAASAEEYLRDEWNKLNGSLSGKKVESIPAPLSAPIPVETKVNDVIINSDGAVSKNSFKVKDLPTITNSMRPVSHVPYRHRNDDRRDIIERAVSTYENVSKRAK